MKAFVLAVASSMVACAAFAESPAANPPATASHKVSTHPVADVNAHIQDLHAKLHITAAQETQWEQVASAMRDSAQAVDQAVGKRESSMGSATAVENLNAYGEIAQAHADSVKNLSTAFAPLYASMSDDQKKTADEVFAHRGHAEKASPK